MILAGTNDYQAPVAPTIDEGRLQIGNGGITGSIVGDVTNNGQLAFDRSDTLTFDGAVSGSGSLRIQDGDGR